MKRTEAWDVIIVGGGPAGLAAALVLARACRRVVVCDDGRPRNQRTRGVHGYPTRDGISPRRFRALSRAELRRHGVTLVSRSVTEVAYREAGVMVTLEGGEPLLGRRLLLATGVEDHLPPLRGLLPLYGRSVHHCPYCDGWQWRGRRLAVYGRDRRGSELSHTLRGWSGDVVLCTDGPARLSARDRSELAARGIPVERRRIARVVGRDGRLQRLEFANGPALERDALFLATGHRQRSLLAASLGCGFTAKGSIRVGHTQVAHPPRVYAAGDAADAGGDVHMVVVAAAEGARAAVAISNDLLAEDRARELLSAAGTRSSETAMYKLDGGSSRGATPARSRTSGRSMSGSGGTSRKKK